MCVRVSFVPTACQMKERQLCIFFRNNHFATAFRYNHELYLLATDLG
jgi:hypothetical protein